jgi:hypothetical protein
MEVDQMTPWKMVAISLCASLALASQNAHSAQFGVTFGGAVGDGDFHVDGFGNADFDLKTGEIDFAFGVGKTSSLIYRLNVGLIAGEVDYDEEDAGASVEDDLAGAVINNTLGFKLVDNPTTRIWVGGTAYLSAFTLDGDVADDVDGTFVGIGPTLALPL